MPRKMKKVSKVAKAKKLSILESAIKNVQGKLAVKPSKNKQTTKGIFCSILIIFAGLFALGLILMVYFQNDNLWSGRVEFSAPAKVNSLPQQSAPVGLANPASEFCVEKGGQWKTWDNSVGEKGICYFSEYRQCEEWAMYRGECPIGGADLSIYRDNKSAQHCLVLGGMVVLENDDCVLPSGVVCNLFELVNGICP